MNIILAEPRGFCSGVKRAVAMLEHALSEQKPVYVYHEIVHNTWLVNDFRRQGAVFVDSVNDVPVGAVLLFSAHGVTPAVRMEAVRRNIRTIDATCSIVEKSHQMVRQYAAEGTQILLLGHRGHDEIVGIQGEAPDAIYVVETEQEIESLPFTPDTPLAFVTQTTLSLTETQQRIALLKRRFPQIQGSSHTICFATQSRQETVQQLAKNADAVIVVGSANSSNSKRLAEVAEAAGTKAFRVDGAEDLRTDWFKPDDTVVITAGASAPEHLVEQCFLFLQKI